MINKTILILVAIFLFSIHARSEEKVVFKYKKYEQFDLGSLEIKGDVVTPGDLTASRRGRKVFNRKLLERESFDLEVKEEVLNLR